MRMQKNHSYTFGKIIFIVGIVGILAVAGIFWSRSYFEPIKRANREIEKLSHDYYENFFYDQYINDYAVENGAGFEMSDAFSKYEQSGFAVVRLRQLLLFDDGRHEASRPIFEEAKCDTNSTYVQFKPFSPYGKKDVQIEYHLSCQE